MSECPKNKENKVTMRIMLVSQSLQKGNEGQGNGASEINKTKELSIVHDTIGGGTLATLKSLMGKDNIIWRSDNVECFVCQESIELFLDKEDGTELSGQEIKVIGEKDKAGKYRKKHVVQVKDGEMETNFGKGVQIIGVKDASVAVLLLSLYKFDLIVFDCDKNKSEFAVFLAFLSTKHKNTVLAKLSRAVLNNRGPLNRLWILPFAEEPNTIIDLIRDKGLSLIHTRWHIDIGANMDETFDKRLKKLIEAQLASCVFDQDELIRFLTYSGQHLEQIYRRGKDKMPRCGFADFQDFMGAEFSTFLRHYGSRAVIRRDAKVEDDEACGVTRKSVFATYVWNSFYGNKSNAALFKLHDLMKVFFMTAATMPEDRNGVMRLRESYRRLRYYIDINDVCIKKAEDCTIDEDKKAEDCTIDEDKKTELVNSMKYFADCIDVLLL